MPTRWRSRDVEITLPSQTLSAMWERARRSFDVMQGGRYDARSRTTMLLWSAELTAPGATPIGAFSVRWDSDRSTIHQIAWAPQQGGTEAQVWRAIRVLAGRDWSRVEIPVDLPSRRVRRAA